MLCKLPKNKIVYNFLITNPNGMNKSFPHRQKYNLLGKKKNSNLFFQFFSISFCCPFSLVLSLFGHNFCSLALNEKKLYSHEAYHFFYLQNKFKKIIRKIQPVGTCPKSHLSPERTMVL